MRRTQRLTAIIEKEDDGYVALCPDLDSQGETIKEARTNLVEALTLFFESAPASEIERRLRSESSSRRLRFLLGKLAVYLGNQPQA
jgi:predicted RNase H-like HicB family nuclease